MFSELPDVTVHAHTFRDHTFVQRTTFSEWVHYYLYAQREDGRPCRLCVDTHEIPFDIAITDRQRKDN